MHILIVPTERYVTAEEPLSGIFQYHQAHALNRAGLKVGVLAPEPRSLRWLRGGPVGQTARIEFEDDQGIPVYRYQGWGWVPGDRIPYLTPRFRLEVGKALFVRYVAEQGRPDVIHAHNALYAGAVAALLQRKYNVPYVLTEHSSAYARGGVRRWQIPIAAKALRCANARIVVSTSLGKLLEEQFGEIACPWEWIPNILEEAFARAVLDKEREPVGRAFRFLNVATLVEVKNHAGLLEAFARTFQGKPDVQLRIGGDGPLRHELETLASELGITSQITFLGLLSREQVRSEMQACDAFVLSSDYETFGVVLIEVLAYGKPVVATASGGPKGIIHSGNGVLVAPRDVAALGHAMEEIRREIDRFNSTAIRHDCLARFGEAAVVEKLEAVYKRVLSKVESEGGT
jgi:glycosyltransferase involved in cell wall biosynthesis